MAGRGVHRGVYSSLVDHPEFQSLSATARHVFLTARVSKQAGPAAIFVCYREVLARQTGHSVRAVENALGELEAAGWVRREGLVVWLVNGLRYDPTMRLANPKHRTAVLRALEELPRSAILATYCEYYGLEWLPDSLSNGYPRLDPPNTEVLPEYRMPINSMSGAEPPDSASLRPGSPPAELRTQAEAVLQFLNAKTGRRFQPDRGTLEPILARLRDGATVGQCKGVIVQRWRKWRGDEKMADYLRPKTLFNRTNFAQYRADLPAVEEVNGDAPAS